MNLRFEMAMLMSAFSQAPHPGFRGFGGFRVLGVLGFPACSVP